jgi:hypothetical protein
VVNYKCFRLLVPGSMENLYTRSYLSIVLFEQTNYSITLLLLPVRANNVQLRLGCVQLGRSVEPAQGVLDKLWVASELPHERGACS